VIGSLRSINFPGEDGNTGGSGSPCWMDNSGPSGTEDVPRTDGATGPTGLPGNT